MVVKFLTVYMAFIVNSRGRLYGFFTGRTLVRTLLNETVLFSKAPVSSGPLIRIAILNVYYLSRGYVSSSLIVISCSLMSAILDD